jgi:4-amino-4-deoxy-L-arabinose transferase-like glycosyltransferase
VLRRLEAGPRLVAASLATALLVLFLGLCASGIRASSATYDETEHLPAGYSYLAHGDFRLAPDHPPLLRALAALPLLVRPPVVGAAAARAYDEAFRTPEAVWVYGWELLYRDNDPTRLLVPARLVIAGLGAVLGLVVFSFARALFGVGGGLVALALHCLDPSILAHAGLVTTDLGAALFFAAALYLAWRCCERLTAGRVLACALAVAGACAAKHTGLLVLPAIALAGLVSHLGAAPWPVGRTGDRVVAARGARLAVLAGLLVVLVVAGWAGVWAEYGFRYRAAREGAGGFDVEAGIGEVARGAAWRRAALRGARLDAVPRAEIDADARVHGAGLTGAVVGVAARARLLPEAYLYGLTVTAARSALRAGYLRGERSLLGWRGYFPIAFLVKTPLPTLGLVVAGALVASRLAPSRRRALAFLLLPPLLYFAVAVSSNLNIGHRHLLPVYPPLFVLAGGVAEAARRRDAVGRAAAGAVLAAVLLLALGTLRVAPYFLTYFNAVAGGPAGGRRWLVDSNLDWGQALPQLRAWMAANGVARVNLAYFGTADPAAYGIDATVLPGTLSVDVAGIGRLGRPSGRPVLPGHVAVSATLLQGLYLRDPETYAFLRERPPLAVAGNAIFVYRVEKWGR